MLIVTPVIVATAPAVLVGGAIGTSAAWWTRRRSTLSAKNYYVAAAVLSGVLLAAAATRVWPAVIGLAPIVAAACSAAALGRRWRLSDLGAGEELRNHELQRRWIWQPAPAPAPGERTYLRSQGELVRERAWPTSTKFVSMTADGGAGPRLPIGDGQHIFLVGATGAGKTTTSRRVIVARTLSDHAALFILDQKGDAGDIDEMRKLAARAKVPFILFDSQDPATDRWQPLWGTPTAVAARCVEPIKMSEPYYYDVLSVHLTIVCRILHAADRWPPSIPFLAHCCAPESWSAIQTMADHLPEEHNHLARATTRHGKYVESAAGLKDLRGGEKRLTKALALASVEMVTPRTTADGESVGVNLIEALKQRAVVMWRTHADTMPDEAAALTVLALADLHDAAEQADGRPWTLLLDEYGAVIKAAAERGVAILQRARSHGGQVIVVTQSVADIEALTGQAGLLGSLTDNFAGIVAHRQIAAESRDWLAKTMGTRAIWQSTNQTASHGSQHSGRGSARRTREFRVGADVFATLRRGQAVIYTPEAGEPARAQIRLLHMPDRPAERIEHAGRRHRTEVLVHPEHELPDIEAANESKQSDEGREPKEQLQTSRSGFGREDN